MVAVNMTELIVVGHEDPVRQGDVFCWQSGDERDARNRFGLVITADCDIAQNKIGADLACLRIIKLEDYMRYDWCKKRVSSIKEKQYQKVREEIQIELNKNGMSANAPSNRAIEQWVKRSEVSEIIGELGIKDGGVSKEIEKKLKAIQIFESIDESSKNAYYMSLIEAQAVLNNISKDKMIEKMRKDAGSLSKSLPGDVFFIGGLPGVEGDGFLVLLREIFAFPVKNIMSRMSDIRDNPNAVLRVGRLSPTYKHAISQQFGYLYSRIGLPLEYEENRESIIKNICGNL